MINTWKRALYLILGSLFIIGGLYGGIAGVVSGFGNTSYPIRFAYLITGTLLVATGVYLYYLGNNKNISKMFSDIIDAIISAF